MMWPFSSGRGSSARRKNERDLKLDYFSHVVADSHRLQDLARARLLAGLPQNLGRILSQFDQSGEVSATDEAQLDWGEIATLEDKILELDDDIGVRRRAWQIRSRYARLVGPERYQAYLGSHPPSEHNPTVPIAAIRADLRRLVAATHFTYSLALVREDARRRVLWKLLRFATALCGVLLAYGWWKLSTVTVPIGLLATVAGLGCLGAYVSVQRRLQNTNDGGDPVIGVLALHEFNAVQVFPLIAGGVFAVLLYLIVAAGFLKGDLFPDLSTNSPTDMANWGKLLVWSFIAGFAERLVPDTLDRLVNQASPAGNGQSVPPAPNPGPVSTQPTGGPAAKPSPAALAEFRAKAPSPPPV